MAHPKTQSSTRLQRGINYMNIKKAVETLVAAFEKDAGFRYSYQANIAMAFVDECARHQERTGKKHLSRQEIHEIANLAADRFLTMLAAARAETVTVVNCPLCEAGKPCADNEKYSRTPRTRARIRDNAE